MDYAIFRTGGKQYRVSPRDVIDVEKLPIDPGAHVELGNVLAVSRDGNLHVGRPLLAGARVVAEVEAQTRDRKIVVFKYKRKVRYRRKKGHRQHYTRLAIKELLLEGEEASLLDQAAEPVMAVLDEEPDDGLVDMDEASEAADELESEDGSLADEPPEEEGAP